METAEVRQLLEQVACETFYYSSFKDEDGVQVVLTDKQTDEPRVWVIPDVLSPQQCDSLIEKAETAGMTSAVYANVSVRTSKRTKQYVDEDLSRLVFSQLSPDFVARLQQTDGLTIDGIHSNWRVVRYDPGDYFCPHYDQADNLKPMHKDGTKDFLFSSHTLIVNLTKDMNTMIGGATRFYPERNYSKAIDVSVPRGWAIAFKQLGMLHAGHQVVQGTKYVAQAGLLRLLPEGQSHKQSVFRLGPGLAEAALIHTKSLATEYPNISKTGETQVKHLPQD